MSITVIGPSRPMRGGIAQHTDELVKYLRLSGHYINHESWSAQFPRRLYRGESIPISVLRTNTNASFSLSWWNIFSWFRAGFRNRHKKLIFCSATPFQYPIFLVILALNSALNRKESVLIAHNVIPHEASFLDTRLTKLFFRSVGNILVHSDSDFQVAEYLAPNKVRKAPLPFHSTVQPNVKPGTQIHHQILFFGYIRKYKGLDVLLEALTFTNSKINLIVAGQFWEDQNFYTEIIDRLSLSDRVEIIDRYLSEREVEQLIDDTDCMVLPYRSATSSQIPVIARQRSKPSIVTNVGGLPELVRDGIDGLIASGSSPQDLANTIDRLYEDNKVLELRQGCGPSDPQSDWARYLEALSPEL